MGEKDGHFGWTGAALIVALALGGCGSDRSFLSKSADIFNFSQGPKAEAGQQANAATDLSSSDIECPEVNIRNGASTLMIGSKPGESEPSALDLRYQGTIINTARECHVNSGLMTMKVGVEGRVITGPAGGPGTVDVPVRIAVVQEGVNPKTVASKLSHVQVAVTSNSDRPTFTLVEPDIAFPLPVPVGTIDSYVVYVGFDPLGAQPQKKKPVHRARTRAKSQSKPQPKPQLKPKLRPEMSAYPPDLR
jgi:hypothetical protein